MSEPQIEYRPPKHYAGIRTQAPLSEWGRVNALLPEVQGWLAERGVAVVGPPMYRYHQVDEAGVIDVEVGWPVAEPVEGDGRVTAQEVPEGDYAVAVHEGSPDTIRETFDRLDEWSDRTGEYFDVRDGVWAGRFETYLTDPAHEPDMGKWRTEVAYLLNRG
ncbi:GyrI-like domain-containing protein [Actinokineospora pegani]|uniref:GyrI-like domain-containing protein n=1 Tax=Actinokineospora pegani TaxID=2654637 RepID=UPI0012E9E2E2|nr:GyrI-like domain-containing protein [Actinokineospora pegani]